MTLESPLETIRQMEANYRPSDITAGSLSKKTLVMLVAPAATGKSYVIDRIIQTDPEFSQVTSFSTREPRPDDLPGRIKYIPKTEQSLSRLKEEIDRGDVVQYTLHATTGNIYGTKPEDYTTTYNLLPTLSSVVERLATLPFQKTVSICLVTKPEIWKTWLNERYPDKSEERSKRVQEAISSLRWMLSGAKPDIHFVENSVSTPDETIKNIINIVKYNQQTDVKARVYAKQMLELATNEEGATT